MIYVILILLGGSIGSIVTWYNSYSKSEITSDYTQDLEKLLLISGTSISEENMNCENWFDNKVSSVLSELIHQNMFYKRNISKFSCTGNVCYFSLSYCKPWQTEECSEVYLKYEIDINRDIVKESIMCILMP